MYMCMSPTCMNMLIAPSSLCLCTLQIRFVFDDVRWGNTLRVLFRFGMLKQTLTFIEVLKIGNVRDNTCCSQSIAAIAIPSPEPNLIIYGAFASGSRKSITFIIFCKPGHALGVLDFLRWTRANKTSTLVLRLP